MVVSQEEGSILHGYTKPKATGEHRGLFGSALRGPAQYTHALPWHNLGPEREGTARGAAHISQDMCYDSTGHSECKPQCVSEN